MIDGDELCPGAELELTAGEVLRLSGTTEGFADDLDTCLDPDADYDGADVVYQFTLPDEGSLRIKLQDGEGLDGNLIVRLTDCEGGGFDTCFPQEAFGDAKVFARHAAAGTYHVIVDSLGDTSGEFELTIEYSEPACGDLIINPGEECDLGAVANDGCVDPGDPAQCTEEDPDPERDECPGEDVSVPEGTSALLAADGYSTVGFVDHYAGTCAVATGGADRVLQLVPDVTGTLTVRVGFDEAGTTPICLVDFSDPGCWDQFLYARSTCASEDADDELACSEDPIDAFGGEEITFAVEADVPVFLFVDGYDGEAYSRGPFNLHFNLVAE